MTPTLVIGGDHAGFSYKESLIKSLRKKGYEVIDKGPFSEESVDYPDYVHPVAKAVEEGAATFGILICGSGNGVAMTANKHPGIRAGLAWNTQLAALARQHNNANVLCIPARFVSKRMAHLMVNRFLDTEFEGGRHARRVGKIANC